MNRSEIKRLIDELSPIFSRAAADVVSEVKRSVADLGARMSALESRPQPVSVRTGVINRAGVLILGLSDGSAQEVGVVVGRDGVDGKNGKDGADGKDADPEAVAAQLFGVVDEAVAGAVAEAVEALPKAPSVNDMRGVVGEAVAVAVAEIPLPEPLELPDVHGLVKASVEALPKPPTAEEMSAVVAKMVSKAVADLLPPKDGVGLAGGMIDRDGVLVLTLTDGTTCNLGRVVGKDGERGVPGADGVDGFAIDDLSFEWDGERGLTAKFERGDVKREFTITVPGIIDRGVYKPGVKYERGDAVSFGGSLWIAQRATSERPESGDDWRLAAKRGRDGKDAKPESK